MNLCSPAPLITNGSWFTLQIPNLLWFLAVAGLVAAGLLLELPIEELPPTSRDQEDGR